MLVPGGGPGGIRTPPRPSCIPAPGRCLDAHRAGAAAEMRPRGLARGGCPACPARGVGARARIGSVCLMSRVCDAHRLRVSGPPGPARQGPTAPRAACWHDGRGGRCSSGASTSGASRTGSRRCRRTAACRPSSSPPAPSDRRRPRGPMARPEAPPHAAQASVAGVGDSNKPDRLGYTRVGGGCTACAESSGARHSADNATLCAVFRAGDAGWYRHAAVGTASGAARRAAY